MVAEIEWIPRSLHVHHVWDAAARRHSPWPSSICTFCGRNEEHIVGSHFCFNLLLHSCWQSQVAQIALTSIWYRPSVFRTVSFRIPAKAADSYTFSIGRRGAIHRRPASRTSPTMIGRKSRCEEKTNVFFLLIKHQIREKQKEQKHSIANISDRFGLGVYTNCWIIHGWIESRGVFRTTER